MKDIFAKKGGKEKRKNRKKRGEKKMEKRKRRSDRILAIERGKGVYIREKDGLRRGKGRG